MNLTGTFLLMFLSKAVSTDSPFKGSALNSSQSTNSESYKRNAPHHVFHRATVVKDSELNDNESLAKHVFSLFRRQLEMSASTPFKRLDQSLFMIKGSKFNSVQGISYNLPNNLPSNRTFTNAIYFSSNSIIIFHLYCLL